MPEITASVPVDAPPQHVWAVLANLAGAQDFHPGVKKSYYNSEIRSGVGAARVCELRPLGTLTERVVEWREGESMTLSIETGGGAPPLRDAVGRFDIQPEGDGCRVTMSFSYTVKGGPLGWLMDRLMLRSQMRKTVAAVLIGLRHHTETGRVVEGSAAVAAAKAAGRAEGLRLSA